MSTNRQRSEFREAIDRDVTFVYSEGLLTEIEPRRLPALAELAEFVYPRAGTTAEAIAELLNEAVGYAAGCLTLVFKNSTHSEIVEGLTTLFGLGMDDPTGLEARRDLAGPSLGHPNNNKLRQAKHQRERKTDWVCREMASQLDLLAERLGFAYSKKYVADDSHSATTEIPHVVITDAPSIRVRGAALWRSITPWDGVYARGASRGTFMRVTDPEDTEPMLSPMQLAEVQSFTEVCIRELATLIEEGFEPKTHLPMLHALAVHSIGGRRLPWYWRQPTSGDHKYVLEDFLLAIIGHLDANFPKVDGDSPDVKGAIALLGIDGPTGATLMQRRDRAATCLGLESVEDFVESGKENAWLDKLIRTIARTGISTMFVPSEWRNTRTPLQ